MKKKKHIFKWVVTVNDLTGGNHDYIYQSVKFTKGLHNGLFDICGPTTIITLV